MKVSIVTVCYNSAETLEATIKSVLGQDYKDIEYILVDGFSKDGTLEIINRYRDKVSIVVSEKDNGLYDALNKGIALATGTIVGLLHSDDVYFGKEVVSKVVKTFEKNHTDGVYADLLYVDKFDLNKVIRYWKSKPYKQGLFRQGWMPPHPTFFVKKEIYSKLGSFNTTLKSAADYELMLRFIHKNKITVSYLPEVIIKMRVGGKSNMSLLNRLRGNREDKMAWKINDLKPAVFTLIRKPLSKLSQFYRKFR